MRCSRPAFCAGHKAIHAVTARSCKSGGGRKREPAMKIVMAIIKPFKLDEVRDALTAVGIQGLTVTEVKGYGRQKSYLDEYQETEFSEAFLPKVEIAMWVEESRYEEILKKVVAAARTGRIGDGKVFTLPVEMFQ